MSAETAETPGFDWSRLGRRLWPLVVVVLAFGAPRVERWWDGRQVERESRLVASGEIQQRLKARVLRVDPGGLRKDWRLGKPDPEGRCADYRKAVLWTLCWTPGGKLNYALVSAYDQPALEVAPSLIWVFAPRATPAERSAMMSLMSGKANGEAAAGGMAFMFLPFEHGGFLVEVRPAATT